MKSSLAVNCYLVVLMIMYFPCLISKKKQLKNVGILVVQSGHLEIPGERG